mgnify:CR=1 FL=1
MKNNLLILLMLPSLCEAQNTLAHWDLESQRVTPSNNPVSDPADPVHLTLDSCINSGSLTVNGLGYSGAPGGSEVFGIATNGYNCFGFWEDGINANKFVGFNITVGSGHAATIESFNFDVFGYMDFTENPSKIALKLFKNNVEVFSNLDVAPSFTTSWQDVTVSFGVGSIFQSNIGSVDDFEVRLYAHEITGVPENRPAVALDNIRINGVCSTPAPEPSTSLIAGFGSLILMIRRRRS